MNQTRLKPTSKKTRARNQKWFKICMERAEYLIEKYGYIICEYSGESITVLATTPVSLNAAWGHHIDGKRDHCVESNCMIVKYRWHRYIHDNNTKVTQEGFEGELSHRIHTASC